MSDIDRYVCTKDEPWSQEKGEFSAHPDAREVGEQQDGYPGGDIVTYHCPNCNLRFKVELPQ